MPKNMCLFLLFQKCGDTTRKVSRDFQTHEEEKKKKKEKNCCNGKCIKEKEEEKNKRNRAAARKYFELILYTL